MQFLKDINPFAKPEVKTIVENSIAQYRRELLNAEATASYSSKMVEYYREGIERLEQQLN